MIYEVGVICSSVFIDFTFMFFSRKVQHDNVRQSIGKFNILC